MAALADDKKAQLREWFASARRRSLPVVPVPFGLTAADLFARPASKSGGAFDPAWKSTSASGYPKNYCGVRYPKNYQYRLGVDFTAAREPFVLADVGVLPEIHGRPRKQTLRLAQQMTEGGIAGVLWNAGRALTFMLPRPVHKSNFRSASPPLLNHDLHAIDAAQARWCGGVVLFDRVTWPTRPRFCRERHPTHWLIFAQAAAARMAGGGAVCRESSGVGHRYRTRGHRVLAAGRALSLIHI